MYRKTLYRQADGEVLQAGSLLEGRVKLELRGQVIKWTAEHEAGLQAMKARAVTATTAAP